MIGTRISSLLGKITVLIVICCLVMGSFVVNTAVALSGSGTQEEPWLIQSLEDFNDFAADANYWDDYTRLETDVNLAGLTYTTAVIAPDATNSLSGFQGPEFTGVFDGNDHKITNLTINDGGAGNDYLGLFGNILFGEVRNLGIEGGSVSGRAFVGGLMGANGDWPGAGGAITNCYSNGSVSGDDFVGGLAGLNGGSFSYCYSTGDVSGTGQDVGGLVGRNYGRVSNCYSTGSISGYFAVGGVVGYNSNYGSISNCYSTCFVSGPVNAGGLVGTNCGSVSNCYSDNSISGYDYTGGLVGKNRNGSISNCYSTGSVSGDWFVGGLVGHNDQSYHGSISNCYSTGGVSGFYCVGGLVGVNGSEGISSKFPGYIYNSYSTGAVEGGSGIGGLVGIHVWGEIEGSFWDIQTSGQPESDGGTGLPTDQMQMQLTFTDAGWDFVGETVNGIEDIWFIPQQDYPHLWWEGMQVPMKLTPRTLNCRSKGNWVKAHLTLPQGFTVADVDSNRPAVLHSFGFKSAPLYVFVNENERVQIEAAFEREAVCSLTGDWPQALTVAGFLADGNIFLGTSTVRIIHPGLKVIEELAWYWLNADCVHPDFCHGIDMNRDSLVNLLDYALLQNSQVEFVSE